MIASEQSIQLAVRNVANWGDTDVLPFPLENHWFHDDEQRVLTVLRDIDENFDERLVTYPLLRDRVLTNVGYVGYRSVPKSTQYGMHTYWR